MSTRIREQGTRETTCTDGAERIAAMRDIVARRQYAVIDGWTIDLTTAHAVVTVHDALSDTNAAKLAAMDVGRMATTAWKLVSR